MSPNKQRKARIAQANHRGSARSIKTELEDAQLLLAWEAGELSEGQLSHLLDMDRVTIRRMREAAINAGLVLAEAIYHERPVDLGKRPQLGECPQC